MGPLLAAGLMQGASMIGDLAGTWFAGQGQRKANERNIALAREQMQFQRDMAHSAESFSERMSSTAYQRKVADLKAAGLNPALAYESGGASSPVGVTAGGSQARVENVTSSAMAVRQIQQAMDATRQAMLNQTRTTEADVRLKAAQAQGAQAQTRNINQATDFEAINQPHRTRALELRNIIDKLGITGRENDQELEKKIQDMKLPGGAKMWIQLIRGLLGGQPTGSISVYEPR